MEIDELLWCMGGVATLGSPLLRFAWEHSMSRQDYVRDTFREWLGVRSLTDGLAVRGRCPHCAA